MLATRKGEAIMERICFVCGRPVTKDDIHYTLLTDWAIHRKKCWAVERKEKEKP